MSDVNEQLSIDEINLVRLVRRLEKYVASEEEWRVNKELPLALRVKKTVQTVKFARRLIKYVEIDSEDTPTRFKRLNDSKMKLDGFDRFLSGLQKSLEEERMGEEERRSIVSTLPLPRPKVDEEKKGPLSIIPPDAQEDLSPFVISTALPSLLPITEASFPSLRNRNVGTGLHDELSSQLEEMAKQLKRNAIHFSTTLGKDKEEMEEAERKIESNYEGIVGQRVKLRDRTKKGWKSTCLVVWVLVVVLALFGIMLFVIRVS